MDTLAQLAGAAILALATLALTATVEHVKHGKRITRRDPRPDNSTDPF